VKVCGVPSSGVIAIVPVRLEISGFAAADHCNDPLPEPDEGEVMVSQGWLLDAVHWRAVSFVVKEVGPVPPDAGTLAAVGLTVNTPPDCVTGKETAVPDEGVTVTVAVREAALGDAATVYWKEPFPVPVAEESVTQGSLLTAVHESDGSLAIT
jgi:hypothetical protein